jgi:hypothetical protein
MKKLLRFCMAFTCTALVSNSIHAQSTWNGSAWSPAAPDASTDAIIASSTLIPAAMSCKNLTINSGITLTSNVSRTVQVYGDIINNGNGTSGFFQMLLRANTCTLSGNLFPFSGAFTLSTASMVFNTNNKLVLASNATATGEIATVAAGATIVGDVTIERYIPSNNRKRYTLVTAGIGSSPTIYNAWQEGGASTAGYGTQITGPTGASIADGFDAISATGVGSIYTYNDNNATNSKWVALTNTNATTLAPGKGFLLFVRGDRTIAPGASSGNTTLRATGTFNYATTDLSSYLTAGVSKYSLVANPFHGPIDWISANMTKTNLSGSFTVYDSNMGVFVSSDGVTKSPNVGQGSNRYIQIGQAFFVQNNASGLTPGLIVGATARTVAPSTGVSSTVFREFTNNQQLDINLFSSADGLFADGTVAVFGNGYQKGRDAKDAGKFTNLAETFSLLRNNENLAIESRPMVNGTDTLFFSMATFSKKDYTMVINGSNFTTEQAFLEDRFTGSKTAINLQDTTRYTFSVTNDPMSTGNNRFMIVFNKAIVPVLNIAGTNIKMSPNPVKDQLQISFANENNERASIKVMNSLGELVSSMDAGNGSTATLNMQRLAAGTYTVQVLVGNKAITAQKIIKD